MIGTLINERYRIETVLGQGGMGLVYRAYDTLLNRPVALKVLNTSGLGTTGKARLLAEAQAAAQLNHPNIVGVYDAGEVGGQPFIVMELVEGESLRTYQPQTLEETLRLAQQICAALEHAHTAGIIHRDLKPENIILSQTYTLKLMDFGLARTADTPHLTEEGAIVGTMSYLAPELIEGESASIQSDLYALGVALYELVAGRPPFSGGTLMAVLSQHLQATVTPPSAHNAEIPAWLDELILRLLSKQAEARPASAGEVLKLLEERRTGETRPVPALSTPVNNLPAHLSRFIGREKEIGQVKAQLAEGRLVTLTGPGGTGKTRLSLQVAAELLDRFEQGIFFVPLADITDPDLVISKIASPLNLREAGGRPLLETVKDYLRYVAWHEGDPEQAVALFQKSLTMFRKLGNNRGIAECLAGLAGLAASRGWPQEAARLLGAAEALLRASGSTWWPADRVEYERNLATLRAALSEEAFATAWAEGQAMTLEQAIAFASLIQDMNSQGETDATADPIDAGSDL